MNKQILLIIILGVILFFRIFQLGGLEKPQGQDPELEKISQHFTIFRENLDEKINSFLPQPQAALLSGILLGIKSDLEPEFKEALRRTSTIHIVVVSGQNLTLLIGMVIFLAPYFGRKNTIFLSLALILIYAVLTGLQIPVLRAAIMVSMVLLAQLLGRQSQTWFILILTALGMLIYSPDWLLSTSFQLSFSATIGVVILAPEIIKSMQFMPDLLKQDFAVTLAAQLLTWPIIASNFHQVSLVGVVVNLFILWTISFVMLTGALAVLASFINVFLGNLFGLIPGVLLTYFVYIVSFFNQLPLASLYVPKLSIFFWIGYYFLIIGAFYFLKNKNSKIEKDYNLLF